MWLTVMHVSSCDSLPSSHHSMRPGLVALSRSTDPFRVLGLSRTCTRPEARARYYALAKLAHPDSSSAPHSSGFVELSEAYKAVLARLLTNPRERGDMEGAEGDGSLLMRLRRDYAGGRRKGVKKPSIVCVRAGSNGEPPCFFICSACKDTDNRESV